MGYYIYYSKKFREARIHYGHCPRCKHGYAVDEATEAEPNGEWLGPYNSYRAAEVAAKQVKAEVLDCAHCMT